MARKSTHESKPTEDPRPEGARVDEHHGMGGSYLNPGGVNHDTEQEPGRTLIERTEERVVRSVEEEEKAAKGE